MIDYCSRQTGCGSFDIKEDGKAHFTWHKFCKDCKVNDIEKWKECHCIERKPRNDMVGVPPEDSEGW